MYILTLTSLSQGSISSWGIDLLTVDRRVTVDSRLECCFLQPGAELPAVRAGCSPFTPSHSRPQEKESGFECVSLSSMGWNYGETISQ